MKFGPQNKDETAVFALEELRADVQYEMLKRMKEMGLSQASLAKKMGVSAAWVSQILDDDANLTLESIAKVFTALSSKCHISAFPNEENYSDALWDHVVLRQWSAGDSNVIEIGRYEAADFIFLPEPRIRPTFVQKAAKGSVQVEDCFEAA